jgi:hypothetical protein
MVPYVSSQVNLVGGGPLHRPGDAPRRPPVPAPTRAWCSCCWGCRCLGLLLPPPLASTRDLFQGALGSCGCAPSPSACCCCCRRTCKAAVQLVNGRTERPALMAAVAPSVGRRRRLLRPLLLLQPRDQHLCPRVARRRRQRRRPPRWLVLGHLLDHRHHLLDALRVRRRAPRRRPPAAGGRRGRRGGGRGLVDGRHQPRGVPLDRGLYAAQCRVDGVGKLARRREGAPQVLQQEAHRVRVVAGELWCDDGGWVRMRMLGRWMDGGHDRARDDGSVL